MRLPHGFAIALSAWKDTSQSSTEQVFDPEAGLTLTRTLPAGVPLNSLTSKSLPSVYAVDFTGLYTGIDGIIWENGAWGRGSSLFVKGSDLVLRAGDGGNPWPVNCAYIVAPCPVGNGTLVWYVGNGTVRAWWNGEPIGTSVGSFTGEYAGPDESAVFGTEGSITHDTPLVGLTTFVSRSEVRYYENQVVS